jgi:hypothetical protein
MDNGTYLKNVMRTLSTKQAQLGLRYAAAKLNRTHFMHATIGLSSEMVEVFTALSPWLLGARQWNKDFEVMARDELGDVGYWVRVLAKLLKVKLPSSTKRIKLKGMTKSEALFKMNAIAGQLASLGKKNFYGPQMMESTKKTPTGKTRLVIDKDSTQAVEQERFNKARALLEEFVPLYWQVSFELFHEPPAELFVENFAKLSERFPKGYFDAKAEAEKDPVKEAMAVEEV